jgi:multiple sugar transport system substrate-binding protein
MKRKSLKMLVMVFFVILIATFLFVAGKGGKEKGTEATTEVEVTVSREGTQKERAEALASQFAGTTIVMTTEGIAAGPPKAFAPQFEKATGVTVKVVELPFEETKSRPFTEHEARTGAVDIYRVDPGWVPDLAAAGVIQPFTDEVKKYMTDKDLADIEKGRMIATMLYQGDYWGMLVDGDIFILYYRADIFENPDAKTAFKAKYGYELAPPKNWAQYNQIGQFITDFTKGAVYGGAGVRAPGQAFYWFNQLYRGAGGKLFNAETMKPTINGSIGVQTMQQLKAELAFGPPGMEKWGVAELWSGFVDGKVAMHFAWPPGGRFAEAASGLANYPTWLPPSKVAGKIKYALLPGPFAGDGPPAAGVMGNGFWTMSSDTANKDAAFAWMMWFNSPEIALKSSLYPNSLMDPYHYSQFEAPEYRAAWPNAGMYLDTLREAGKFAIVPTKMLGGTEYDEIIDRAVTSVMGGKDIQAALDDAARQMEEVTNRLGRDRVKATYQDLLKLQGEIRQAQ